LGAVAEEVHELQSGCRLKGLHAGKIQVVQLDAQSGSFVVYLTTRVFNLVGVGRSVVYG
jgi:hypothetical protein